MKQLLVDVSRRIKIDMQSFFGSEPNVEVVEHDDMEIFVFDGKPILAKIGGTVFPTLYFDEAYASVPRIVVNMGAVPYVCNGADVMAPGIIRVEGGFDKNDVVFVVDEQHRKPIAVGVALFSSQEIRNLEHGKAVKNIHFVGDKLWNSLKKI